MSHFSGLVVLTVCRRNLRRTGDIDSSLLAYLLGRDMIFFVIALSVFPSGN